MNHALFRPQILLVSAIVSRAILFTVVAGAQPQAPDLSEYRTTQNAKTATLQGAKGKTDGQTGYLGISIEVKEAGKPIIVEVAGASPAERAGLKRGDELSSMDGKSIKSADDLRGAVQQKNPGDVASLEVIRQGSKQTLSATLEATSKPVHLGERAIMGLSMAFPTDRRFSSSAIRTASGIGFKKSPATRLTMPSRRSSPGR